MSAANTNLFRQQTNNFATTLSASCGSTDTTLSLDSITNLPTTTAIDLVIDRVNSSGTPTPSIREYVKGVVSGSTLADVVRGLGGSTAQEHAEGAVVECVTSGEWATDLVDGILEDHDQSGHHMLLHDTNGNTWIDQTATTSAVNNILVSNAATGDPPTISVEGSDTNIDLTINAKGTGVVNLPDGSITTDTLAESAVEPNNLALHYAIGTIPASSLTSTGNLSITGVGFTPQLIKFTSINPSAANGGGNMCDGMATSSAQRVQLCGMSPSDVNTYFSTSSCLGWITGGLSTDTPNMLGKWVSMDSSGFTVDITTAQLSSNTVYIGWEAYA